MTRGDGSTAALRIVALTALGHWVIGTSLVTASLDIGHSLHPPPHFAARANCPRIGSAMHEANSKADILVVDDEREHAQVMCEALSRLGHKCDLAYTLADARSRMEKKGYDVVVTDLMTDGRTDGLEVLRESKGMETPPPVLLVTAHADVPTCKQALKEGAYD